VVVGAQSQGSWAADGHKRGGGPDAAGVPAIVAEAHGGAAGMGSVVRQKPTGWQLFCVCVGWVWVWLHHIPACAAVHMHSRLGLGSAGVHVRICACAHNLLSRRIEKIDGWARVFDFCVNTHA